MSQTFLNMNGELENLSYKEITRRTGKKISWSAMNEINKHKCYTQEDRDLYLVVKKYVGKVTVFDFNNMMEWGHLFLYPHFIELAIKNGAKDLRRGNKK